MIAQTSNLAQRIESGKQLLLAEFSPPRSADAVAVREMARRGAGKVHALGVSDNRDHVALSALAAASLAAAEGLEPILHLTTRDRNRIALVSDVLGAQALGIRNLLCTSGTHQTLRKYRAARNVYDIDSVQFLHSVANLSGGCAMLGEEQPLDGAGRLCLGGVASPFADPPELQLMRLAKKVQAGAQFLITQPVFDAERFAAWWNDVTARGLHEKVAIVAGIQPLCGPCLEEVQAGRRPAPLVPQSLLSRITAAGGPDKQRAAAVEAARETIERLSGLKGLRGVCISLDGDPDAAWQTIESVAGSN